MLIPSPLPISMQTRPDRDRYVKVLKRHIEPRDLIQFSKRGDNESTSNGYAYDYESVMHYAADYYSTSPLPTLKVWECY